MLLFSAFAWLVLAAAPASAASAAEAEFSGFDANGDGKVTMSEVMGHIRPAIQKAFDAMDRNHDGVLSSDDFQDVSEGMQKFQQWLDGLLEPFSSSGDRDGTSQEF